MRQNPNPYQAPLTEGSKPTKPPKPAQEVPPVTAFTEGQFQALQNIVAQIRDTGVHYIIPEADPQARRKEQQKHSQAEAHERNVSKFVLFIARVLLAHSVWARDKRHKDQIVKAAKEHFPTSDLRASVGELVPEITYSQKLFDEAWERVQKILRESL